MYRRRDVGVVTRALHVLEALRGFKLGRRISDVAAEVGASERTVRRDFAELQDAGFEIEISNREHRSYACLHSEQAYSAVPITKRERFTLLAVRSVFEVLHGTPFLEDVGAVMQKLEQRMSAKERVERDAFGERFMYMPDHGTKSYARQGRHHRRDPDRHHLAQGRGLPLCGRAETRAARVHGAARNGALPQRPLRARCAYEATGRRRADRGGALVRGRAIHRRGASSRAKIRDPPDFDMRRNLHGAFGPHLADDNGPHDVVSSSVARRRTWSRHVRGTRASGSSSSTMGAFA